jgi:hypothetical protein
VDTKRIPQTEEEHEVCFHCLNTGWVMLTSENDYGELEDYYFSCSGASARSVVNVLGAAHVLLEEGLGGGK